MNTDKLKAITGRITFEYDFLPSMAEVNAERIKDGGKPLTRKEMVEWIKDWLSGENLHVCDGKITVSFSRKNGKEPDDGSQSKFDFVD